MINSKDEVDLICMLIFKYNELVIWFYMDLYRDGLPSYLTR